MMDTISEEGRQEAIELTDNMSDDMMIVKRIEGCVFIAMAGNTRNFGAFLHPDDAELISGSLMMAIAEARSGHQAGTA
jgi:hypothetical protein